MRNLIKLIAKKLSINFEDFVKNSTPRKGEDKLYWINSNKIKNELNW